MKNGKNEPIGRKVDEAFWQAFTGSRPKTLRETLVAIDPERNDVIIWNAIQAIDHGANEADVAAHVIRCMKAGLDTCYRIFEAELLRQPLVVQLCPHCADAHKPKSPTAPR